MEFINDLYNPDAVELMTFFKSSIDNSMKFMRNFLSDAQIKGELNPDLNLNYIMFMMQKEIDLCGTQELMSMFPDAGTMTRQVTQTMIYGIMPVNTIHNS